VKAPSRPHVVEHWHITGGILYATVRSGNSGDLHKITSDPVSGVDTCSCTAGKHDRPCSHRDALSAYVLHDPRAVALRYALEAFALDARRSA
jgi:hypothetical protein